jgi:hypothetical protein
VQNDAESAIVSCHPRRLHAVAVVVVVVVAVAVVVVVVVAVVVVAVAVAVVVVAVVVVAVADAESAVRKTCSNQLAARPQGDDAVRYRGVFLANARAASSSCCVHRCDRMS